MQLQHGGGGLWSAGGPFAPAPTQAGDASYGTSPISHIRSSSVESGIFGGDSLFAQPRQGQEGAFATSGVSAGDPNSSQHSLHHSGQQPQSVQHMAPAQQHAGPFSLSLSGYGGLPLGGVPSYGTGAFGQSHGAEGNGNGMGQHAPPRVGSVGSDLLNALTRSASSSSMGGGYSPYGEMAAEAEGGHFGFNAGGRQGGLLGSSGAHPLAHQSQSPLLGGFGRPLAGLGNGGGLGNGNCSGSGLGNGVTGAFGGPAKRSPSAVSRFQFARDESGGEEAQPLSEDPFQISTPQDMLFFKSLLPDVNVTSHQAAAGEGAGQEELGGVVAALKEFDLSQGQSRVAPENGGYSGSPESGSSLLLGMRTRQGPSGSRAPPPGFGQKTASALGAGAR